ncbi:MAG TPA: YkvA family protein [Micromonosporaceae bacterium]|nr:YkvA family protein [Micromonosporaceae bacterium]
MEEVAVEAALGLLAATAVTWLALALALLAAGRRLDRAALRAALRLLPDVVRLASRLAADPTLPRGVRLRVALLAGYLALPIDLVPDFVPVLGYADDAVVAALALRGVARRAGLAALRRHWPGTEDGFAALCRLCGLGRAGAGNGR